jgi:hypothetical protein
LRAKIHKPGVLPVAGLVPPKLENVVRREVHRLNSVDDVPRADGLAREEFVCSEDPIISKAGEHVRRCTRNARVCY